MQNSVQAGNTIIHTPTADVTGGELLVFSGMVGVAVTDIAEGSEGTLATVGVFELPKGTMAFAQGQVVYAAADGTLSASADGGAIRAGVAWAEAAGSAAVVSVKINV